MVTALSKTFNKIINRKGGNVVTVYTVPNCTQCNFTKKFLEDNGIPFNTVDLTEDAEAHEKVKSLGFQKAPVVIAKGVEPFFGFRPDILSKLKG